MTGENITIPQRVDLCETILTLIDASRLAADRANELCRTVARALDRQAGKQELAQLFSDGLADLLEAAYIVAQAGKTIAANKPALDAALQELIRRGND